MSAVRSVRERMEIPLACSSAQRHGTETNGRVRSMIQTAEPNADVVLQLWTSFTKRVAQLHAMGRTRSRIKQMAFVAAMDNLCRDFSRRTESVKTGFLQQDTIRTSHCIEVLCLSSIPDQCRQAGESIVATVPVVSNGLAVAMATEVMDLDNPYDDTSTVLYSQLDFSVPVACSKRLDPLQEAPVKSTLDRMKELESIKGFLTVTEYDGKRSEILASI